MTSTPDSVEHHRRSLARMSAAGGPLRADAATATTANPAWFATVNGELRARPARRQFHKALLERFRERTPAVGTDRKAILLAGPPGAGKSTVLRHIINDSGIAEDQWRVIDADHFKEQLLQQAVTDGSYEDFLTPTEVHARQAEGEQFYPLELASLVHEESSVLGQQARAQAIAQGENIVIDTVLGNATYAAEIGASLRNAGYEVTLVEVEVNLEDSVARTQHRWREGYVAAEAGNGPALGGRWVPEELPASLYDAGQTDSRCRSIASSLAQRQPAVRIYEEHRVDPRTGSPTLEARYERASNGSMLARVPGVGISDGFDSIRNVLRAQNGSGRGAGSGAERRYEPPTAGSSAGLER